MVKVQVIKVWIYFFSKLVRSLYFIWKFYEQIRNLNWSLRKYLFTVSLSNSKSYYHGESCLYLRGKKVP